MAEAPTVLVFAGNETEFAVFKRAHKELRLRMVKNENDVRGVNPATHVFHTLAGWWLNGKHLEYEGYRIVKYDLGMEKYDPNRD